MFSFMSLIGKSPYKDVPNMDMLSYLQKGGRLPQPDGCTDTWYTTYQTYPTVLLLLIRYNLMRLYWSDNASDRPSATSTIDLLSKPPFVRTAYIKGLSVSKSIYSYYIIHSMHICLYRLWCEDMTACIFNWNYVTYVCVKKFQFQLLMLCC